jgi:hypothetical protein
MKFNTEKKGAYQKPLLKSTNSKKSNGAQPKSTYGQCQGPQPICKQCGPC